MILQLSKMQNMNNANFKTHSTVVNENMNSYSYWFYRAIRQTVLIVQECSTKL